MSWQKNMKKMTSYFKQFDNEDQVHIINNFQMQISIRLISNKKIQYFFDLKLFIKFILKKFKFNYVISYNLNQLFMLVLIHYFSKYKFLYNYYWLGYVLFWFRFILKMISIIMYYFYNLRKIFIQMKMIIIILKIIINNSRLINLNSIELNKYQNQILPNKLSFYCIKINLIET